jgi:ATP-dependent RNA helicase DeaD
VHRIGRTGRAGRKGMAVTFVSGRDIYKLQHIERYTRTKILRGKIPTAGEVEERRAEAMVQKVREVLDRGNLSMGLTDRLLSEGYNSTDIAAALFELLAGPDTAPEKEIEEPRKKAAPTRAEHFQDSSLNLRPASRGMQWVRVSAGRETRISPRDIIGLLEDSLGLPVRSVGIIDILPGQSFAQVPQQFLDVLRDGPRLIETNSGDIQIALAATQESPKEFKKQKFPKKSKGSK